jgi:hypothetical protein
MVFSCRGNSLCDSHLNVRRHASGICHWIQIPWNLSYSWWKHAHSSWEDGRQLEARNNEFTEPVLARVSPPVCENMPCCGFSRSSLWQLACTDVKYGPLFTDLWCLSNHPCTRPSSWLSKKIPGVKKSTDTYCVLREIGQMPILFY